MTRRSASILLAVAFPALMLAVNGCRHDGASGITPAAPEATRAQPAGTSGTPTGETSAAAGQLGTATGAGVPAVLGATIQLPPPGETQERWLSATVTTGSDGWFMAGCVSPRVGVCHWNPRFPLDEAERGAYAARIGAIRAMPRCEPVGFAPGDYAFDLDLDGEGRSGHIPQSWFVENHDPQPPNDGSDPCMAEVYVAWWIYVTLNAHGHVGPTAAQGVPLPRCHESCCGPDDHTPGPDGTVECCFCDTP